MTSEDHVINDSFVNEITYFNEARYRGHHAKNRHCVEMFVTTLLVVNLCCVSIDLLMPNCYSHYCFCPIAKHSLFQFNC